MALFVEDMSTLSADIFRLYLEVSAGKVEIIILYGISAWPHKYAANAEP